MIRVIIERRLKTDRKKELIPLLNKLRAEAVHRPGYVSAETLSNIQDASIMVVLSAWRNLTDWQMWEESKVRAELYQQIEPLLMEKPRVSIFRVTATEGMGTVRV
jgi:heme-degrading monooxygenase HmoA